MDVRRPAVTLAMGLLVCGGAAACSSTEEPVEPDCLDQPADATCQNPLYGIHGGVIAPTFDDVFTRTLQPVCAASGCHSGASPRAGMQLDDIDLAYEALMSENAAGEARVIPGDVQCGKVIVRLEMAGKPWSMPPGKHLDEGTLCAIRHWIANGAPR